MPAAALASSPPWFDGARWKDKDAWAEDNLRVVSEPEAGNPLIVIFSSAEIGSSIYVSTGFKRALGQSLDAQGFQVMGTTGLGGRQERLVDQYGVGRIGRFTSEASFLLGYQWKTESAVIAVFVGPEIDHRLKTIDGYIPAVDRPTFGGRLLAEIWAHPTNATLATGTLLVGTAPLRVWARHRYGWRVWDGFFAGPEAALSLEEEYTEARVGLHLTGLQLGGYTFNVSGGLLLTEGSRPGGYAGLTVHFKL